MPGNKSMPEEIGQRITALREECGFTQQQLAEKLFVKRETLSMWESGKRQIKGADIAALADALNTNCDFILRGVDTANIRVANTLGLDNAAIENITYLAAFQADKNTPPPYWAETNDIIGHPQFKSVVQLWHRCKMDLRNEHSREKEFTSCLQQLDTWDDSTPVSSDELTGIACGYVRGKFYTKKELEVQACAESYIHAQDNRSYCQFLLEKCFRTLIENLEEKEVERHG